jgi:cellulose synthase (UDP-forming)
MAVRVVCVLAVAAGLYYLGWRLLFTLNSSALWLSVPLWAAEAFGLLSAGLFFFTVWDPYRREGPPPPAEGLSVDIFVPTYNEPAWIVRRTLLGALSVRYPHETYLLDDGKRPEMEALARKLGVRYLTRPDNTDAKAGNLNHALRHTSGDFVAFFDADHVAMPEFLDRTLGYFRNPKVAFVQTPHEFYNIDSFQHRVDHDRKRMWHEQALFFRLIQPGKDRWNAAFFCGSCAVIRRTALEDVGGIATETVTEDLHTSIRLHSRGWQSAYQNEVLAYGISPQGPLAYGVQRLRWGQGAMQVLRRDNPLLARGLTLAQRLNYLSSNIHYFEGLEKIVYYLAPPLYLATGVLPIRAPAGPFLARFAVYYVLLFAAFKLSSRGYGMGALTEGFKMTRFYTYLKTIFGLVARRRLRFRVTDKESQQRVPVAGATPYLFILGLNVAGLTMGAVRLATGTETSLIALGVNAVWSLWHLGLAVVAARRTLTSSDNRRMHRAQVGLPVRWEQGGGQSVGVLVDVHEEGGCLIVEEWPGTATEVRLDLLWPGHELRFKGQVRWTRRRDGGVALGLRWTDAVPADLQALEFLGMTFGHRKLLKDLDRPMDRVGMLDFRRNLRRERREPVSLPAKVLGVDAEQWAVVEDTSTGGALVLASEPPAVGAWFGVSLWGGREVIEGRVVRVQRLDLPPHAAYRVGIQRDAAPGPTGGGEAIHTHHLGTPELEGAGRATIRVGTFRAKRPVDEWR